MTNTRTQMIETEIAGYPDSVQQFYWRLIDEGNTPEFASMLALRQAPRMKGGDRIFCEGNRQKMIDYSDGELKSITDRAKKAGVSVGNKYHVSGLGPPEEPTAWVSNADDVLAVCKKRGLTVTGAVNYEAPVGPAKKVKLADDIANDLTGKKIKENPDLQKDIKRGKTSVKEIKQEVIKKHGQKD